MTRDGILKLARECGIPEFENNESQAHNILTFFARIQQHLSYDGIHTCNDECQKPACVATRRAVEREREACARIVEANAKVCEGDELLHKVMMSNAEAIRARGNQ
jgi:hypothetical protein